MIDKETIRKVAHLARLEVTEEEVHLYAEQLHKVIGYFEQIDQIDTQDIEPLVTATEMEQVWREDELTEWSEQEKVLEGAPEKSGRLFKVPPVV